VIKTKYEICHLCKDKCLSFDRDINTTLTVNERWKKDAEKEMAEKFLRCKKAIEIMIEVILCEKEEDSEDGSPEEEATCLVEEVNQREYADTDLQEEV